MTLPLLGSVTVIGACGQDAEQRLEALYARASACEERPFLGVRAWTSPRLLVNAYFLQEEAARALRRGGTPADPAHPSAPVVLETLDKARRLGAKVVRTWAFADDPSRESSAMQRAPLVYDELSLRGLDVVLAAAHERGLSLVLPLVNFWSDYGGVEQYVRWAGLDAPIEGDARFFTEPAVIAHFEAHVRALLERRSAVDGHRLGAHPAVLAWELVNEPRVADPDVLVDWVRRLTTLIRTLAPSHLVASGEEGFDPGLLRQDASFWSMAAPQLTDSPGAFERTAALAELGYASAHFFPEAWGVEPSFIPEAGALWISRHAEAARRHGKPLVLGEFGLRRDGAFELEERRALYRGWLTCARRAGVAAAGPWMLSDDARPESWDRYAFKWHDGTEASDPRNQYVDLLAPALLGEPP